MSAYGRVFMFVVREIIIYERQYEISMKYAGGNEKVAQRQPVENRKIRLLI